MPERDKNRRSHRVTGMSAGLLTIAVVVLGLGLGAGGADIYQWVDESGSTHFADQPPQDVGSVGEVKSIPTRDYPTPTPGRLGDDNAGRTVDPPDELDRAENETERTTPEVELYTTRWCGYCEKAREYFRARGIAFTEYDIERDPTAARRKRQLDPQPGIPFAVVNGQAISGFSPSAYARALESTP